MSSITASDLTPAELDELVTHGLVINRLYVAALAWMVYEHFITLDKEITHMWYWSKRIEVGRILFFLNRYGVPLEFIPIVIGNTIPYPNENFCSSWYSFQQFANLASLAVVQICLMLRTWALYGARRNHLIGLSIFMIACAFASGVIIAETGGGTQFIVDPTLTMIGCDNVHPLNDHFWCVWVPIILFDFVLCVMSIFKVLEHRRDDVHSPLVDLLHRDGLAYFVLSLSLGILNACMYAIAPLHLKALGVPILSSVLCVACSRMLLNVRALAGERRPTMSEVSPPIENSMLTTADNNINFELGERSYPMSLV